MQVLRWPTGLHEIAGIVPFPRDSRLLRPPTGGMAEVPIGHVCMSAWVGECGDWDTKALLEAATAC